MTWRRLGVLVRRLPRDSMLVVATVGEPALWGVTDYLLANVVDGLGNLLYAYVASHSKGHTPQPKPVPRPDLSGFRDDSKPVQRKASTPSQVASFFGRDAVHTVRR